MQNTSLDHVAHQLANKDACGRTIDYMRIAITDRCNSVSYTHLTLPTILLV